MQPATILDLDTLLSMLVWYSVGTWSVFGLAPETCDGRPVLCDLVFTDVSGKLRKGEEDRKIAGPQQETAED